VLGQDDPAMDLERVASPDVADDVAQDVDVADEDVVVVPLERIDGKEKGAAGVRGASVVGHDGIMPMGGMRCNARWLLRPCIVFPRPVGHIFV